MNLRKLMKVFVLLSLVSCGGTEFFEEKIGLQNVNEDPVDFGTGTPGDDGVVPWGNPTPGQSVIVDGFVYSEDKSTDPADILFVVDNSGSMGNEQQALADNFDFFINDFVSKEIDFNMAIVTTDMRPSYAGVPVTNSMSELTYDKYLNDSAKFFQDFSDMILVGTGGSGTEQGLAASKTFLEDNATSFIRDSAHLVVIYVSDEEDQSDDAVKDYTDYIKSLKTDVSKVQAHSIVRTDLLETSVSGLTTGGARYIEASQRLNGTNEEITNNFGQTLSNIGTDIVNKIENYVLSNQPVASSIKVVVDGALIESGWSYNASLNSIEFESSSAPVVGAEIKVYYYKI